MTTISQDIRGALQSPLASIAGFPPKARRKYEGAGAAEGGEGAYTPPAGGTLPWARLQLVPTSGKPLTISGGRTDHQGFFYITLFYPASAGTADIEIEIDAVKAAYRPGRKLVRNGETIKIASSERVNVFDEQPDWIMGLVSVTWRCLSARN